MSMFVLGGYVGAASALIGVAIGRWIIHRGWL